MRREALQVLCVQHGNLGVFVKYLGIFFNAGTISFSLMSLRAGFLQGLSRSASLAGFWGSFCGGYCVWSAGLRSES